MKFQQAKVRRKISIALLCCKSISMNANRASNVVLRPHL
ncbi:hypothetical protein BVRB_8g194460 [Beta vulgaris subsp. vulgaris]|nr:hypothetical protein BVRB_8g194460 [Beta vulgaris subsp. vulgaris]